MIVYAKKNRLSDDECDRVAGDRAVLVGKIQKRYGISQKGAEQQRKCERASRRWWHDVLAMHAEQEVTVSG
jgi:hypothetical protein